MTTEVEMVELKGERSRRYVFAGGPNGGLPMSVTLDNVTHLAVRSSGNHRLRTADGKLHIVAAGWKHIEIDADSFTV